MNASAGEKRNDYGIVVWNFPLDRIYFLPVNNVEDKYRRFLDIKAFPFALQ